MSAAGGDMDGDGGFREVAGGGRDDDVGID